MPRNCGWFRVYDRFIDDEKIMDLTLAERGLLVSIWALTSSYDGPIPYSARALRKRLFIEDWTEGQVEAALEKFRSLNLLETGEVYPVGWIEKQFPNESERPDSVAERKRKQRHLERLQKNGDFASQEVTECHDESQEVTPSHDTSQNVTSQIREEKRQSKEEKSKEEAEQSRAEQTREPQARGADQVAVPALPSSDKSSLPALPLPDTPAFGEPLPEWLHFTDAQYGKLRDEGYSRERVDVVLRQMAKRPREKIGEPLALARVKLKAGDDRKPPPAAARDPDAICMPAYCANIVTAPRPAANGPPEPVPMPTPEQWEELAKQARKESNGHRSTKQPPVSGGP